MLTEVGSTLLDRYYIHSKLGRGGYGKVFVAYDTWDECYVAVKISRGKGETKERNLIEEKVLWAFQGVQSPYRKLVVDIKNSIVVDDCVILVLELLSYDLRTCITQFNVMDSFSKISIYARQMIEFLIFLEQLNVIHGDIKPENILLGHEKDKIKFADFGMCHAPFVPPEQKMEVIQTRYYRAPEVILGIDYDASADVWSLGCVLMECLTGCTLFEVKTEFLVLERIAFIIGPPSQDVIARAPNRDRFFDFDCTSKRWIMKGTDPSEDEPIGLKGYLERYFPNKVDLQSSECIQFLDLVDKMLRVDPKERQTPINLFCHGFISKSFADDSQSHAVISEDAPIAGACRSDGSNGVSPQLHGAIQ